MHAKLYHNMFIAELLVDYRTTLQRRHTDMASATSCDSSSVGVDEAVVTLSSELNVSVWSQSEQCWQVSVTPAVQLQYNFWPEITLFLFYNIV